MTSAHLHHILDEIDFLIEASAPLCRESFLGDATMRRAFVRSLEVIGVAAARIPAAGGETEDDLFGAAAIYRRVCRDPFEVDYDLVWEVVAREILDLRPRIQALLAAQGDADQSGSNR